MRLTLNILGLFVIFATLLPLVRKEAWWIRIFDFPRIQIAVLGVVVLATDLVFRSEPTVSTIALRIALGAAIVYQAYMIYPYTFLVPRKVKPAEAPRPGSCLRLLISNVQIENRNAARLSQIIRDTDPDVILILEADDWWRDSLAELEQTHPLTVQKPLENAYGMVLYSRLKIVDSEILFRVYDDVPSIRACVTLPSGMLVELHCLHPKPPVPQEDGSSMQRDAELLIVGRQIRGKDIPLIVMGDLNDVAWSHTNYLFQRISGLLDPRIGRGFYNTFHARYPIMRFPLDHFFHSNHFRLISLRRLPYIGSDHFPMFISLSYEPDAVQQQKPESPSSTDQQEASEKINRAGAELRKQGRQTKLGQNRGSQRIPDLFREPEKGENCSHDDQEHRDNQTYDEEPVSRRRSSSPGARVALEQGRIFGVAAKPDGENVAKYRDAADDRVDRDVDPHAQQHYLGEIVLRGDKENDGSGEIGDHITHSRNQSDDRIQSDANPRAWNREPLIQKIGKKPGNAEPVRRRQLLR